MLISFKIIYNFYRFRKIGGGKVGIVKYYWKLGI